VLEKEVKKDGPAAVPIRDETLGSLILGHLDHLKKMGAIWAASHLPRILITWCASSAI
jgi:hypothetical protein